MDAIRKRIPMIGGRKQNSLDSGKSPVPDKTILEAQADFALKLLREVSKDGELSTVVSPTSVAITLAMVYAGAGGKTANEMAKLLAKGAPESKVHEYFGELFDTIKNGQKQYTLEMANKVYVKSGFSPLDAFTATINHHYGGQFEPVDFTESAATAKQINQFVEQASHAKIHDLIKADMLDEKTCLVLINATYFKGDWTDGFPKAKLKLFHISEAKHTEIHMLHKVDCFIYHENDNLQLLGIPYVGEEVHMFLLLPKKRFGLINLLANLSGKALLKLVKSERHRVRSVDATLPKFKLESEHHMNSVLQKLGMPTAFGDDANFEDISREEELKISQVLQKVFIEIDEKGTEARVVTRGVLVSTCSIADSPSFRPPPPPPPKFVADHPFAAFLVSGAGSILFSAIFRG